MNHISLTKIGLNVYAVTHCMGHTSANTRPHWLHWSDWVMGTSVSCIECNLLISYSAVVSLADLSWSLSVFRHHHGKDGQSILHLQQPLTT